ncbi:hypothetical protein Tsubulata_022652, partial [Turnera subulata]
MLDSSSINPESTGISSSPHFGAIKQSQPPNSSKLPILHRLSSQSHRLPSLSLLARHTTTTTAPAPAPAPGPSTGSAKVSNRLVKIFAVDPARDRGALESLPPHGPDQKRANQRGVAPAGGDRRLLPHKCCCKEARASCCVNLM